MNPGVSREFIVICEDYDTTIIRKYANEKTEISLLGELREARPNKRPLFTEALLFVPDDSKSFCACTGARGFSRLVSWPEGSEGLQIDAHPLFNVVLG